MTADKALLRQCHRALDSVWAAIGDRLLENGPLDKGYANAVMFEIRNAQKRLNAALAQAGADSADYCPTCGSKAGDAPRLITEDTGNFFRCRDQWHKQNATGRVPEPAMARARGEITTPDPVAPIEPAPDGMPPYPMTFEHNEDGVIRHPDGELVKREDYDKLLTAYRSLARRVAEAELDARRYKARRAYEWCNYDEYCNSVMPRDGTASRQNDHEFIKGYDDDSDGFVSDYLDDAIDAQISAGKE